MSKTSFGDIEAWALANGFSVDSSDGRLKAPYQGGIVAIEPLARNFRVVLELGESRRVLISATPSKTSIDEDGMLHGAGLFSYFHLLYLDEGDDGILPVWFNERTRSQLKGYEPKARERRGFAPRP
jgi:hypothetical protein